MNTGLEESEFGYGHLLSKIWRRRFWFAATSLIVLSISFLIISRKESTYQSSMQLLIEPNYQPKEEDFTDNRIQFDYATQLSLLQSSSLLQKTIQKLKKDYPDLTLKELKSNLSVTKFFFNEEGTKIFQVTVVGSDPIATQKILEALQFVYQAYNLEQQEKRLRDGLSFVDKQLIIARRELMAAETSLKRFRIKNNLITPEEVANNLGSEIQRIEQERSMLRIQIYETRDRYNFLKANLKQIPPENLLDASRLSQSARYQALLAKMQETDIALAEQRVLFHESYPSIQDLVEKRKNLSKLLLVETQNVLGQNSIKKSSETSQQNGQLTSTDLDLISKFKDSQLELQRLIIRDQGLAQLEQQQRANFERFPALLSQFNQLVLQVDMKQKTIQQLLQSKQVLGIDLNRGGFNWQVVESPDVGSRTGPDQGRNALLAVVVALFLGGTVAFLREAVDDSIHSSEEVAKHGICPVLGSTPQWRALEFHKRRFDLSWSSGFDSSAPILSVVQWLPFRESLDLIYKRIQLFQANSPLKSLVITSALAEEGKTTLLLGLALSAERTHQRILIIDANLRNPTLHRLFNITNEVGLSTLLTNSQERFTPHRVVLGKSKLDLLTAGPRPDDPVKLLASHRMKEMVRLFEKSYDLILIDSPALLGIVDAVQIASQVQGVILAARLDRVTQSELLEASGLLAHVSPLGIIINGVRETMSVYSPVEQNSAVKC